MRHQSAPFTPQQHQRIRDGFKALGVSDDYFNYEDVEHLRRYGGCSTVEQILDAAREHLQRGRSDVGRAS